MGQDSAAAPDATSSGSGTPTGFHFVSLTAYWSKNWLDVPQASINPLLPNFTQSTQTGVSAVFNYSRVGPKSSFSIRYTPTSYWASNFGWHPLDHALSLAFSKSITPSISWVVSGQGVTGTYDRFLYLPTQYAAVSTSATTISGLADAVLNGTYSNEQLAALLTGTPLLQSPAQSYFLNYRFLTANLGTGVTWAATTRLSFRATASLSRSQNLSSIPQVAGVKASTTLTTTGGSANVDANYDFTPRTTLGFVAMGGRSYSAFASIYYTSASVTFGHRWSNFFMRLHGGGGQQFVDRSVTTVAPHGIAATGGATIGFKTYSQTVLASYSRNLGNSYGIPGQFTGTSMASWIYAHPGQGWSLQVSFTNQQIAGTGLDYEAYRGTVGISRAITRTTAVHAQYTYDTNHGALIQANQFTLPNSQLTLQGVRVSFTWSPNHGFSEDFLSGGADSPQ